MNQSVRAQIKRTSAFDSSQVWLITFSDLLFLLLTFFVFRVSMTNLEKPPDIATVSAAEKAAQRKQKEIKKLAQNLEQSTQTEIQENPEKTEPTPQVKPDIQFKITKDGVLILLGGGRFASGSRELSQDTKNIITSFVAQLEGRPVKVRVEGHTDNRPIHSMEFPSNWELSTARAISVALAFTESGFPGERISAVGYADTRPIADNEIEEGREQNRRIEILVTPTS